MCVCLCGVCGGEGCDVYGCVWECMCDVCVCVCMVCVGVRCVCICVMGVLSTGKEMLLAMFPSLCGPCEERQKQSGRSQAGILGGKVCDSAGSRRGCGCGCGVSLPPSRP